jgi:hypothetical protein
LAKALTQAALRRPALLGVTVDEVYLVVRLEEFRKLNAAKNYTAVFGMIEAFEAQFVCCLAIEQAA